MTTVLATACALCGVAAPPPVLEEVAWGSEATLRRISALHPGWSLEDGACPACVQEALLLTLIEKGEAEFHAGLQSAWPLDALAAFGAIPTPLRLHADPRLSGRGVTIALVDAAFYPHDDLVRPRNRIRAWVDARTPQVEALVFGPEAEPRWPGWEARRASQWHGLMTSAVAAGNGHASHGLYRGLASEAEVVLVEVMDDAGRIGNASIERALVWLETHAAEHGVRVISLSLGGESVSPLSGNAVDAAVARLVAQGITVVVAAGNDGERRLVPPATAPLAVTVGGLDDRNTFDHGEVALWHSNYGETAHGAGKPEIVAPSLWVVAPILPMTELAAEARDLFDRRRTGDPSAESRLAEAHLVTPHYQHVEGTSFAAPITAGVVATMLEANPTLSPQRIREILRAAAQPVPGAPSERQGAGALVAGRATAFARADVHGAVADFEESPVLEEGRVRFLLHEHGARNVCVLGSWDRWTQPGRAREVEPGVWEAEVGRPAPGTYSYKFLLDGERWLVDHRNPARAHDGFGGFNSRLVIR